MAVMCRMITSLALCFLLAGCGGMAFKTPKNDFDHGGYKTSTVIRKDSIIKYEPYPGIEQVEFVVLIAFNDNNFDAYYEFIRSSLLRIGFKSVISELEFIQRIQERNLGPSIGNVYDWNILNNLNTLSSEFPKFLVIESVLTNGNHGGTTYLNRLLVIDPQTPVTLVEVAEVDTLWSNAEKEFAYPTANFLRSWYEGSR
jgi:hypothetical protein